MTLAACPPLTLAAYAWGTWTNTRIRSIASIWNSAWPLATARLPSSTFRCVIRPANGVTKHEVDAADRNTDVLDDRGELGRRYDLANVFLGLREQPRGLFDAGARRCSHVKAKLTRIDVREEVTTEEWNERYRDGAQAEEGTDEDSPPLEQSREHADVRLAQPLERARRMRARGRIGPGCFRLGLRGRAGTA